MLLLTSIPRPHPLLLLSSAALLLLAYLWALASRPGAPDWKRVEDPGKYGFPSWYAAPPPAAGAASDSDESGTGSEAGPAPKLKLREPQDILFFIDLPATSAHYATALATHDALVSRSDIALTTVSRAGANWDGVESLGDMCKRTLWRVGEDEGALGDVCPGSIVVNQVLTPSAPLSARANITVLADPQAMLSREHAFESLKERFGEGWEMGLLVHGVPFVGSSSETPAIFHPTGTPQRSVAYYPRAETLKSDYPAFPGGKRYTIVSPPVPKLPKTLKPADDGVSADSAVRRAWSAQQKGVARSMARGGVCLFEDWATGVLDARLAAAMLSGCLVATVPPDVEHASVGSLVLPLTATENAAAQIDAALKQLSDAEIKRRVLDAFMYARQHLVPAASAEGVLEALDSFAGGGRGYLFPKAFRWTGDVGGGDARRDDE